MSRAIGLVALMLMAGAAGAAELERMFYTPAQRATLDNARKQNIRVEFGTEENEQQPASAPVPHDISLNGVIRRSDGKSTIWLNNRLVNEQQSGVKAAVGKNDNRVRLSVPESGRSVDLKVGQTVEIVSGTVAESYLRRPAPKLDPKTAAGGENTGSDVPKVTTGQTRDAVKSESLVPKRPARTPDRDTRDDSRSDNDANAK